MELIEKNGKYYQECQVHYVNNLFYITSKEHAEEMGIGWDLSEKKFHPLLRIVGNTFHAIKLIKNGTIVKVISSSDKSLNIPNLPKKFISSYIESCTKNIVIKSVLVEVNVKSSLSTGCEGLGFVKDFKSYKIKNGAVVIEETEDKVYTEEEIIFGVRKMLASENIKFHYVREELPKFLEEAKKEIISFKTNLKK